MRTHQELLPLTAWVVKPLRVRRLRLLGRPVACFRRAKIRFRQDEDCLLVSADPRKILSHTGKDSGCPLMTKRLTIQDISVDNSRHRRQIGRGN